jgi:N-methylhydantoinase A
MTTGARVGVDIGGTFTDIVLRRPGEPVRVIKIPTTRGDPSQAVLKAVDHMRRAWGVAPREITRFLHGTTVATNAVLERKGARIGLLATAGFRDVLEIGRQMRHQMYDLALDPETPVFLAPGRLRKEVTERIGPKGEVIQALDEESVARAADELASAGCEAIAIAFLFSFLNDAHEKRARDIVLARHPQLLVSISSEVDPAFREYERTVVTAFDAYIKPVVDQYLGRLEAGLATAGIEAPLQVMQSRGGVSGAATARLRPVRLFLSGPAAGVIGGRMAAESTGIKDVITVDVGGTSSDIALIEDGRPALKSESSISGYPVRVAMVDVNTIGAGGGSIAWIDKSGGLKVGPQSAGSEPGPACYGRGGTLATVTDASIVLGYLDPRNFAGGTMTLSPDLARRAIAESIARPLGLSLEEAALGIHRVVNAQMAEGIRLVSIRQGHDPRRFALLPMGGAGPLHGCPLADDLGITRIIIPRLPGVLSAAGLLAAPIEHEASAAFPCPVAMVDMSELKRTIAQLDERCTALMQQERVDADAPRVSHFADVCYIGQAYSLEVELHASRSDAMDRLTKDFFAAHDRVYGYAPNVPIKIVNVRAVHSIAGLADLDETGWRPKGGAPVKRSAPILVGTGEPVTATVYDRAVLPTGFNFAGPAIIEQSDTTTLVTPGWRGRVDDGGNVILER